MALFGDRLSQVRPSFTFTFLKGIGQPFFFKEQPVAQVLQSQLSGYGTRPWQVARVLDLHNVKEPCEMDKWDEKMVRDLIKTFVEIRFPTIYVLNKIDHKAADANIAKISEKYGEVCYSVPLLFCLF